jgi:hypothetical protein
MTTRLLSASRAIDITGKTFGRLAVVEPVYAKPGAGIFWRCLCNCGKTTIVRGAKLRNGHTISCGCAKGTHGHTRSHNDQPSPTYRSWTSMIARCTQPSNPAFAHYKRRGIKVCRRWRKFENFFLDMGERPDGTSLDRWPDNDGMYEPGNCRWATKQQQGNNRISNIHFTYRGQQYTLADLARATGVAKDTLRVRLVRPGGWTVEAAVETPVIPRKERRKGNVLASPRESGSRRRAR